MGAHKRTLGWLLFVLAAPTICLLPSCSQPKDPWEGHRGPPRVVTTIPPLYCFLKNVGGDDIGLIRLLSTQGPHEYQGSPQDAQLLRKADLFIINGLGLDESFSVKLQRNSGNERLTLVELAEEALPEKQRIALAKEEKPHDHGEHGHHHHGTHDPHAWLGVPEAKLMVKHMAVELAKKDPARAAIYTTRADDYLKKLDELQAYGDEKLRPKVGEKRRIIAFHDSLSYFARSFGLEIAGSIEPVAGIEPSSKHVVELINLCKEQNIRVVAVEPQYPSNTVAQTLLSEIKNRGVNAQAVVVNPLETAAADDDPDNPDWYIRKMRENIDNLAKAFHDK